jgi:NADPH:quinone reductase-like Zn-dependent oxidoreductase
VKAAFIEAPGPAEAIRYGRLPDPRPGSGQLLVRVEAVAANPVDTLVRSGGYPTRLPFPFVVGRDLVGVVEAAGPGAGRFPAGTRVWSGSLGHDGRQGSFAEHACVDEQRLYRLPDGVDPLAAVAAVHPATTAYTGLVHHAGARRGERLLVGGAAGNVGSAALRLAVDLGCEVVATARGEEDLAGCRRAGAAHAFDYRDPELTAKVRAAVGGVDVHWDTSGRGDLGAAVELLAERGRILLTAVGGGARLPLPVRPFYVKGARLVGFAISRSSIGELAEAAAAVNRLLAAGRLRPRIAQVLPLAEAATAHRLLESGHVRGRLLLRP